LPDLELRSKLLQAKRLHAPCQHKHTKRRIKNAGLPQLLMTMYMVANISGS